MQNAELVERVDARAKPAVGIALTQWLPGREPSALGFEEARVADGVICAFVDTSADPQRVLDTLAPICGPDLTREMVEDLLTRDSMPRVAEYSGGSVRKVSAFAAHAVDAPDAEGTLEAGRRGQLVFELVEFFANSRWLLVACHEAEAFAGATVRTDGAGEGHQSELIERASERWRAADYTSAGDLGVVMLHELTLSFSAAHRQLGSWLDAWEVRLHLDAEARYARRHGADPAPNAGIDAETQATLVRLRGLVSEFRARLHALDQRRCDAARAWFGGVSCASLAVEADVQVDDALRSIDRLTDVLRGAFDLLNNRAMEDHLHLQWVQNDQAGKLQRQLETVTSLFLVPSLIAAFFGANTALPGGNDTHAWASFEIMVATMVVGALATFLGLRKIRSRGERSAAAPLPDAAA